jgi:hypothetical protein
MLLTLSTIQAALLDDRPFRDGHVRDRHVSTASRTRGTIEGARPFGVAQT